MAGTVGNPTIIATTEAATKKGSAQRTAFIKWLGGGTLTREEKRIVAQLLNGSIIGTAFEQISGVYV